MKRHVYTVLDCKAASYSRPLVEDSDASAVRMIASVIRDGDNMMSRYPGDYSLWCIGEWDDQSGELTAHKPLLVRSVGDIADEVIALERAIRAANPDLFDVNKEDRKHA